MKKILKNEKQEHPKGVLKGAVLEVPVAALDETGFGRATVDRVAISVRGALPGEVARIKITHVSRSGATAETIKILRHSPDRLLSPPCTNGSCDGCPMVLMKYQAQLALKSSVVAGEIASQLSPAEKTILPIIPSPKSTEYRTSAKLVIAGRHADPVIGIYRRHSHDVVDISRCPLHHPLINRIVEAARGGIKKGKIQIFSPRTGNGLLRYLAVRVSEETNRAMVVLVTAERSYNELHHLAKHLQTAVPEITVIVQNINSSEGNVVFGQRDVFLTKDRTLIDTIGDIKFTISPRSFFQVNTGGAKIIYEKVREFAALRGSETVVDLYCGVGGISLFLAREARKVVGIESVEAAVEDAKTNAALNGITNCTFLAGDSARLLEEAADETSAVDLIVLNPPRKGCEERVLRQAAALSPIKMIYVSCSPHSLAADLRVLQGLGYGTELVQPIDMFPQTPHMENVALISKI